VADVTTLGRYRIERVLGQGAMGVVYEAFDPRLHRRVAIKTILKSHLDPRTAQDYSQRFIREAHAVAKLNHPHIVQVHDFGEEGDVAYLVMEFVNGRELKSYFDSGERFDLKQAVRIVTELCEALEFAHRAGIVHRDVKPGNVMLDAEMRAKLTDFGVARVQDPNARQVTQAGTVVGTPAYMSPEQIAGRPVDARSDVFSTGVVLYQFLTGELPFDGGGAWTIAKKIMQDEPALPSTIDTTVSPLFDSVVAKALAKRPEYRYQSAHAMGVALTRALEGKSDSETNATVILPDKNVSPAVGKPTEADVAFWRSIQDSNDPRGFELYLEQFPDGIYAKLAQHKLALLIDAKRQPSATGRTSRFAAPIYLTVVGLIIVTASLATWVMWRSASQPTPLAMTASSPAIEKPASQPVLVPPAPIEEPKVIPEKAADKPAPAPRRVTAEDKAAADRAAEEKRAAEKVLSEKRELERIELEKNARDKAVKELAEKRAKELLAIENVDFLYDLQRNLEIGATTSVQIRQDAAAGSVLARMQLCAVSTIERFDVGLSPQDGIGECRALASDGIPMAHYLYGRAYGTGRGVQRDPAQAAKWYRLAAQKGNAAGMSALGVVLELGVAVEKDYVEAVKWHRMAADRGYGLGYANLGWMYAEGRGVKRDDAEALRLFRLAAEKNEPVGMHRLGQMAMRGQGMAADYSEALRWYRRAVEKGLPGAMYSLGWMYAEGRGVPRDDAEAVKWYRKAAAKGDGLGMTHLGWHYETGRGVAKDGQQALSWYRKAVEIGYEPAKRDVARLAKALQ
jgi:serine/threonine protein kinase/TPR repeat protein